MPRDSNGVFSLVPGYLAVTGQVIEAAQHNPPLEDIAAGLTGSLPRNGSAPMLGPLPMAGSKVIGLATGTDPADAVRLDQMNLAIWTAINALMPSIVSIPPGTVAMYAGNSVPTGWLECHGLPVSRTIFAGLFAAVGTRYGSGDGSTTFNVPDARGQFARFLDTGAGVDPGRQIGSKQGQDLQPHSHGVSDGGHAHGPGAGSAFQNITSGNTFPDTLGGGSLTVTSGATAVSQSNISILSTGGVETRPRNIAFWAIIKT